MTARAADPATLLAAHLDAAEAIALAASPDGHTQWRVRIDRTDEDEVAGYSVISWPGAQPVAGAMSLGAWGEAVVTHIVLRDPESTRADIAADRLILALYEDARRRDGTDVWEKARFQALGRVVEIRAKAWETGPVS